MNKLYIKNELFNIFDLSRFLFNDYYNGHDYDYTEEEITTIKHIINSIESKCKDIKEELQ